MTLHVRALRLLASTPEGNYGTTLTFKPGLTVLRADNSSGKSTCMQAILYGLGLEGMLSASYDVPLPRSMTHVLQSDGREVEVLESQVEVEIANQSNEVLTLRRFVKAASSKNLVQVTQGPAITTPRAYPSADFFVREPGSAQRPVGLYPRLASFLGWELPSVSKTDGGESPLYMEAVFPLFFVEQKRGWAGLQLKYPFHLRIRDVHKRAVEFVLRLDAYDYARRRSGLQQELQSVKSRWATTRARLLQQANSANAVVEGLPEDPPGIWPISPNPPTLLALLDNEWRPLLDVVRGSVVRAQALAARPVPTSDAAAPQLEAQLGESEQTLTTIQALYSTLHDEVEAITFDATALQLRIKSLTDDLRKYQDVEKLQRLGSVKGLSSSAGECPTCHQTLADTLLPLPASKLPLSVDENIRLIKSQLATFGAALRESKHQQDAKRKQLDEVRRRAAEVRSAIRAMKESLTAASSSPSVADVEERLRLNDRIGRLRELELAFASAMEEFALHAARWQELATELKSIETGISSADTQKLTRMEELVREQMVAFGVDSVNPAEVRISRESYKPSASFELEFDLSASDLIRVLWAYLNSFLEVAREFSTNHLGLLVMDEPRQQDAAPPSMGQLLIRVSSAHRAGQQVIVSTSEDLSLLKGQLQGVPHHLINVQGKILKRLE